MKKRLQLSGYVTGDVCVDCGHLRHARGFLPAFGMEDRLADCCPKCGSINGTKKVVGRVLYDEGGGGMAAYWRSVEGFYPKGEESAEDGLFFKGVTNESKRFDWFVVFCVATPFILFFLWMACMFS